MVAAIEQQTGERLHVEGRSAGGQVGAAYVRGSFGRAVLTWRPGVTAAEHAAGPGAVVAVLAAAGYPAPVDHVVVDVPGGVAIVQERRPGRPVDVVGVELVEAAAALNQVQRRALSDHESIPPVELYLTRSGPGYCLHEPLEQHSGRTRALLRRVQAIGARTPEQLAGDDAVHVDYQPGNFLVTGPAVTGVVDWDGAGRGDCGFDLVTLRFGLHGLPSDPAAIRTADDLLAGLPPETLESAWASMALRMVDWAIRHWSEDQVEHWLKLAEQLPT